MSDDNEPTETTEIVETTINEIPDHELAREEHRISGTPVTQERTVVEEIHTERHTESDNDSDDE